ncbi:MAG: inositol monophosphatase family protein [Candidatus Muiribacteriota bacterium]
MINKFEKLIKEAGKIGLEGYNGDFKTYYKAERNPVTEYDTKIEKFIINYITENYPDYGIYSEEDSKRSEGIKYTVYLDPIDGTVNFSRKIPFFCISFALYKENKPEIGIVYLPVLNQMFTAQKGKGSFLNGKRISVSETTDMTKAIGATGFPYDKHISEINNINNFGTVLKKVQGLRRCGSAAIDICYTACGNYDFFWELKLNPWDMAAGILIAQEAGAIITKIDGSDFDLYGDSIIVSNKKLHQNLLKLLL